MIANEQFSNASIAASNNAVATQNQVVRSVGAAVEAIRRMQVRVRDIQPAPTAAEVDAAFAGLRQAGDDARTQIETAGKLSTIKENRDRLSRATGLIADYLGQSGKWAGAVRAT